MDQYDAYRTGDQAQGNPWSVGAGPQQFYGESSSLWGNILDRTRQGARTGKGAGAMAVAQNYIPWTRIPVIGSAINAFKGGGLSGLGDANNWRNFASFGARAGKASQQEAKNARRRAVDDWQIQQRQTMGEYLGQQGADVRRDLQGELDTAIGAGGAMGDMGATQNALTAFQQRYQQYMLGRQQAGQARKVDAMMTDPGRISSRNQRMQADRTQQMGDLAEQYRIGQRDNAFNQARRGMQGSSVDVEKQGELGRGRDKSAQNIQAGLDSRAQQYRLGDQQQRSQLMGLIYGGDDTTAQSLALTQQGLQSQGQQAQENQVMNAQGQQQRSATSKGYSQALGGAMSAGAKPLEYYLSNQGGGQ